MDLITAEFNDMMMGRIPKFEKTTAIYPKLEVQRYDWKQPFKEGGNKHQSDEITLRASTIVDGIPYYEQYTIIIGINDIPVDVLSEHLQKYLIESVKYGLVNAP
jgi:hypothetical protein